MLHSNSQTQRVFIVGDNSLFEEGITKLLACGSDLSVSGAKYTNDSALLDAIAQHRPDVIVVNESMPFDSSHILELLFMAPLQQFAPTIIVMRLDNTMIDVYEMPKRFNVTKRDELVAVVRGDFQYA